VREHTLHFHLVHEKDSSPIGYQKVCKAEEKPVSDDEVVKAFEQSPGEFVFLSDEDFEQARERGARSIDVLDFVPAGEIDPIYFAKTYYLGPADGAERVYALLARALEESGLVAVATFVMRDREHVAALRIREGVITLEQLHFADEIRPVEEIRPERQRVGKEELAMARRLIESGTTAWQPERYEDTYEQRLREAIEAKRRGEEVHRAPEPEDEGPVDLLEALRASVERASGHRKGSRAPGDGDLSGLRKSELVERARKAGIEGRSTMSKDELVEALRSAA
jgi:DNA end-binding protein Ku